MVWVAPFFLTHGVVIGIVVVIPVHDWLTDNNFQKSKFSWHKTKYHAIETKMCAWWWIPSHHFADCHQRAVWMWSNAPHFSAEVFLYLVDRRCWIDRTVSRVSLKTWHHSHQHCCLCRTLPQERSDLWSLSWRHGSVTQCASKQRSHQQSSVLASYRVLCRHLPAVFSQTRRQFCRTWLQFAVCHSQHLEDV